MSTEPNTAPQAEPPHHCASHDIAALIARLEALADPEQEAMPSFADTDWRTLSSVCHRVISYLVDLAATPSWQGLTDAERAEFVNDLCQYGTDFVSPLFATVGAIEDKLMERNLTGAPQAAPKLEDIEQYRMQMAGISTAALGYWKESDGILPDYDTVPLRDVAKLYAKYDALYKARTEWVEVTERLPEDRSEVLFFSGDLRNPASMLLGMYIDGEFCCAGYTMANVTHWAKRPVQPDIEPPEVV